MVEFRMPSLGADMEAGTLVEWLVKPGDRVKRGDIVAVVETQKGAIEIETFQSGQIEQILVDLDSKVPVGTPLALIRTEGEAPPGAAVPPPPAAPAAAPAVPPPMAEAVPLASPADRRCPRRRGPHAGVTRCAAARRSAGDRSFHGHGQRPGRGDHLCRRRAPPRRGARSAGKETSAVARSRSDANGHRRRDGAIEARNPALLSRASGRRDGLRAMADAEERGAAARQPTADRSARNQGGRLGRAPLSRFQRVLSRQQIRTGAGGACRRGDCHSRRRAGGAGAARCRSAIARRADEPHARSGATHACRAHPRVRRFPIRPSRYRASGERGVEALYGIIYPPQVAIVGFGKAVVRPWVVDGAIGPRSVITITLSADHRVSDGHAGALFLAEIGKLLQEPDKL